MNHQTYIAYRSERYADLSKNFQIEERDKRAAKIHYKRSVKEILFEIDFSLMLVENR